ncbi:MAG: hypothetical protein LBV39_04000 [Bacteroidales bacterium]|nr:hypothetical protein [Bacteroidales bacterium]
MKFANMFVKFAKMCVKFAKMCVKFANVCGRLEKECEKFAAARPVSVLAPRSVNTRSGSALWRTSPPHKTGRQ